MDGESDVHIAPTALRIVMADGSFTSTGADSLSNAGADAFQRLADVLLKEWEQRFGACLQRRLAQHGKTA